MTEEFSAEILTKELIQIESTNPGACESAVGEFISRRLSGLPGVTVKTGGASRQVQSYGRASGTGGGAGACVDLSHGYSGSGRWVDQRSLRSRGGKWSAIRQRGL